MTVGQVPADGVRAGVQPRLSQCLAQLQDELDGLRWGRTWAGVRGPGPGPERGLALGPVAGQEFLDPRAGHPVVSHHLADGALLNGDGSDDQPGFRHALAR